jgi:hypothetical protein
MLYLVVPWSKREKRPQIQKGRNLGKYQYIQYSTLNAVNLPSGKQSSQSISFQQQACDTLVTLGETWKFFHLDVRPGGAVERVASGRRRRGSQNQAFGI